MTSPLLVTEFAERARRHHPHREIVAYSGGEQVLRYDYGAYAARVARLAGALRRIGIRPGDRVATLCWNHHRHLELYAAVPLAGAVLHTLNLRLSAEEIAYIAGHADDRLIVADPDLRHLLDGVRPELGVLDTGDAYEELIQAGPELDGPPERDENDLAVLCYTSGTTGRPKGVGYTHRGLYLHTFAACLADGHAISARDTVLHVVPLFHANAWGIPFAATMAGAAQVLPGPHPSVAEIAAIVERERVTYVGMVPTVAVDLLDHVRRHGHRRLIAARARAGRVHPLAGADPGVGGPGCAGVPGLGDDRDLADGDVHPRPVPARRHGRAAPPHPDPGHAAARTAVADRRRRRPRAPVGRGQPR